MLDTFTAVGPKSQQSDSNNVLQWSVFLGDHRARIITQNVTETNYDKWIDCPYLRLRFHLITVRGDVESFLIQIEYNGMMASPSIDEWLPIVRFDHNPHSPSGHDIEVEGLHLDILDVDGTKHDVKRGFPPVSVNNAPEYCEDHLLNYADYYACQFENRNGLWGKYSTP